MKIINPERKLFGVNEAAEILGFSPWTLRSWAYSGKIASHKVSTRLMFSKQDLDDLIQTSRRPERKPNQTEKVHAA